MAFQGKYDATKGHNVTLTLQDKGHYFGSVDFADGTSLKLSLFDVNPQTGQQLLTATGKLKRTLKINGLEHLERLDTRPPQFQQQSPISSVAKQAYQQTFKQPVQRTATVAATQVKRVPKVVTQTEFEDEVGF